MDLASTHSILLSSRFFKNASLKIKALWEEGEGRIVRDFGMVMYTALFRWVTNKDPNCIAHGILLNIRGSLDGRRGSLGERKWYMYMCG